MNPKAIAADKQYVHDVFAKHLITTRIYVEQNEISVHLGRPFIHCDRMTSVSYAPKDYFELHDKAARLKAGLMMPHETDMNEISVNFDDNTFYLLSLTIERNLRGKGIGNKVYDVIESIAHELGCCEIRQTPSGWAAKGETRKQYLNRRGWLNDGREVYKRIERTKDVRATSDERGRQGFSRFLK